MHNEVWGCAEILPYNFPVLRFLKVAGGSDDIKIFGKISAQPHTIVKQICFPNGNVLFLSLFSLSKN